MFLKEVEENDSSQRIDFERRRLFHSVRIPTWICKLTFALVSFTEPHHRHWLSGSNQGWSWGPYTVQKLLCLCTTHFHLCQTLHTISMESNDVTANLVKNEFLKWNNIKKNVHRKMKNSYTNIKSIGAKNCVQDKNIFKGMWYFFAL